jgi:cell wall-associated NlpC family hydrolase
MNKKFAAIGVMALTLTTCSVPSQAIEPKPIVSKVMIPSFLDTLHEFRAKAKLEANATNVKNAISKLKKYAGKTWYVFSGSTPKGWDCSGLTMWTYEQLGVELVHSASVQKNSGKQYKTPKVGDIVAFGWKGWTGAGHVGIYIGNGKMIHSPAPGQRTRVESVKSFGNYGYSKITYTRIIETS